MIYIINLCPHIHFKTKYKIIVNHSEIIEDKNYLVIGDGHENLTDSKIKVLYEDFKNTKSEIMSPLITFNNTLEYFGAFTQYIDENIINLYKIKKNNPAFQYIQNTHTPYENFYLIQNKNNILKNIFDKNDFLEYSNVLKNIKLNPFVEIQVKNHKQLELKKDFIPFHFDSNYLKDIFNTYNNFGLVSFKFIDSMHYINNIKNKTILIIESSILTPDKDCGSLYIYYMILTLINLNYTVHFITSNLYYDKNYTTKLQKLGVYVIYNYSNSVEYHIYKNYNVYDYVFICRLENMFKYFHFIKKQCKSKIIFITHDLQFLRNPENIINKNMEIKQIKNADCSVVVSKLEKEILNLKNVEYIPICYKINDNYVRNIEQTKDIYFIGSSHPPNMDGLEHFIKTHWVNIKNELNIQLHVIGSGYERLHDFKNENIIFHGFVPDEKLNDIILNCRLNIVPLRIGAGIKGKILQSLNNKIPTITTSKGMEGMELKHLKSVIMLNLDDINYVKLFVKYYNHIELLKKISDNGYKIMKKFYSLEQNKVYFNKILT